MPYAKINNGSLEEYPLYLGDLETLYGSDIPPEYISIEDTPPPSDLVDGQYFTESEPHLEGGTWKRTWELRTRTEEELQQRNYLLEYFRVWGKFPPEKNIPNWNAFNEAILADIDFNTVYATVNATHPLLASSLPTALSQVASNGIEAFALVFNAFIGVSSATSEQREAWADLATAANLPQEFVDILLP